MLFLSSVFLSSVLSGCALLPDALLLDELVLGEEIQAAEVEGAALSALGAAVAVEGERALIGAPGSGEVLLVDADGEEVWRIWGGAGLGQRVWLADGQGYAWKVGEGIFAVGPAGASLILSAPQAAAIDRCPDGTWWSSSGIGDAVRCTEEGLLWLRCEQAECAVQQGEDGAVLGQTSAGSAVDWIEGVACWGDARLEDDPSPGAVQCADGRTWEGLDGDHLGAAMGGGWSAGVFNKWQVPARARLVRLDDGRIWTVDRAAERSRIAVDSSSALVAVGVPGWSSREASEGRVFLVTRW